jgi:NCS1 family nucleobase:cation symporter-1
MTPFFDLGAFYTGFASHAMGGVDISLFIGLPIGGGLYWLFTRKLDVAAEQRLAEQQAAELEKATPELEDLAGVIVD